MINKDITWSAHRDKGVKSRKRLFEETKSVTGHPHKLLQVHYLYLHSQGALGLTQVRGLGLGLGLYR